MEEDLIDLPEAPDEVYDPGSAGDPGITSYLADEPDNSAWAQGPDPAPTSYAAQDMGALHEFAAANPQYGGDYDALVRAYSGMSTDDRAAMSNTGLEVDANGNGTLVDLKTGQPLQPGSSAWTKAQELLKPLATFASSGLGQAALKAGIGLGAAAIARAVNGGTPSFRVPTAATPTTYAGAPTFVPPTAGAPPTFGAPTAGAPPQMGVPTVGTVAPPPGLPALSTVPGAPTTASASAPAAARAVAPTAVGGLPMNTIARGAAEDALTGGGAADLTRSIAGALEGQGNLGEILGEQSSQIKADQAANAGTASSIRMDAYGNILDAMGKPMPLDDAIQAGLSEQIMRALGGQYSNPQLEAEMADNETTFQQKMLNQLGPGWETSTAGIQARRNQDIKQAAIKENDKKATVQAYASAEQARRQFNITNPQQQQTQSIANNKGLLETGLVSQAEDQLAKNLQTIAPVGGLINQQGADAQASQQNQANLSTTLGNLQAQTAANSNATTASIANASAANQAQREAYAAAVAQGARQDQAIIAANQAYYNAMLGAGARQDEFNMAGATNNFNAGMAGYNFNNTAALQGANQNFAGQMAGYNFNNQAALSGANTNNANAVHAGDQTFAAQQAANNFTNQANLAGAQNNFTAQNQQAQAAARGIGAAAGTVLGSIAPGTTQPQQTYTIAPTQQPVVAT